MGASARSKLTRSAGSCVAGFLEGGGSWRAQELPEGHRYPMQKYERAHRALRDDPALSSLLNLQPVRQPAAESCTKKIDFYLFFPLSQLNTLNRLCDRAGTASAMLHMLIVHAPDLAPLPHPSSPVPLCRRHACWPLSP